jgi:hypothetical protein
MQRCTCKGTCRKAEGLAETIQNQADEIKVLRHIIDSMKNRKLMAREVIEWIQAGKYRSIQHRHDGSFRLVNEALNIDANGDSLESIVNCEFWPKFRDCTERAP